MFSITNKLLRWKKNIDLKCILLFMNNSMSINHLVILLTEATLY